MNSFIEYKVEDIFFLKNWHHLLFLIWKAEELRSFGIFQWKIASRLSWFCSWPLLDFFLRSVAFDRKKKTPHACSLRKWTDKGDMNSARQPGVGAAAHGTGLQRRELPIGLACLCGDSGSGLFRAGCQVGKRYPGHQPLTGCGCFSLNPGMYTLESTHACSLQSCSHIHTHNPHQYTLVYRSTHRHTHTHTHRGLC